MSWLGIIWDLKPVPVSVRDHHPRRLNRCAEAPPRGLARYHARVNDSASITRKLSALLDEGGVLTDPAAHRADAARSSGLVPRPRAGRGRTRPTRPRSRAWSRSAMNTASASCRRAAIPATAVAPRPMPPAARCCCRWRRLQPHAQLDPANYTLMAEAGCILAKLQAAAAEAERYFPLSLGSEGSCMLGGNLSTNAGGLT